MTTIPAGSPPVPGPQRLVIPNWHPQTSANRSHDHWRKVQRAHHADRDMAYVVANASGWKPVRGRVRLAITLVYPRKYRVDADNLAARCKGLIDGLRDRKPSGTWMAGLGNVRGFFTDDSTEWLDLHVRAEVRPGVKQTEITLEPIQ